jgi:signal transduction histidine kinase
MPLSRPALARLCVSSVHREDAVLTVGLFALALLEAGLAVGGERPVALAVIPALTLPLAWRRGRPAMVALIVTAALAAQEAWEAIALFEQTFTGFVCVIVAAYSLGRYAGRQALVLAGAGCAVAAGLAIGLNDLSGVSGVIASALVLAPAAAGRAVLARVSLREQLEKQARELEATAGAAAEAVATDERARIAGELQDVVGHRVSEMVVQAQVARRLAEREPGRATTAIEFVEARGREALEEMRRLLGVLRRGDEAVALAPMPTLVRLGALAQAARGRGHTVELVVGGEPANVPPGLDVAAYRVIEQALLEATDRSGDGPVTIRVAHDRRWLELEVARERAASTALAMRATDAPRPAIGIRERVAAFGGDLEAGDRADGAYHLRARLPLGGSRSAAVSSPALARSSNTTTPPEIQSRGSSAPMGRFLRSDAVLTLTLIGVMAVEAATVSTREGPPLANAFAAGLVAAPLLMRRSSPLAACVLGWAAASAMTVLFTPATELASFVLPVVLYSYAVSAYAGNGRAWAGLTVGASGILALNLLQGGPTWGDVAFPVIVVGLSWLAGRAVRSQIAMAREVVERAQTLERAGEEGALAAAAQERERIARELHDVVAHTLSVMVIQAGAARRNLERAPGPAVVALGVVEETGRTALTELRRLLALVRPAHEDAALAPQPGMAELPGLVERTRASGMPVKLRVEGQPTSLPGGLDLAAYRVVQEALTNALRHAGPANVLVTVLYGGDRLLLEIADDGRGQDGDGAGEPGHGIAGMRERIGLYGGELAAGPHPRGGFVVRASMPIQPTREPTSHEEAT